VIQAASRLDLAPLDLLGWPSAVLNASDHSAAETAMTPGETSYEGPPTGTTLHIKRPRDRRIVESLASAHAAAPAAFLPF